ncbi:ecto-NOX disulfide-thiol exchanger 1 [Trichonephila inaurata madagascariensis]|uniref:Ecto-NOX disulfide-thiol exchanger 1 n=1 Tax=Trichonephila inaurata madagascariensis TaxID=2747483 RepID=A0A8X7C7K9_9ARAC|nr:ecto-NOX disulfide-thiol exchanger 1 [Trichonephila inaurata madagascariensis]
MPPPWSVNNGLPTPASSVGINSNVCATPVSNRVEMITHTSAGVPPYENMTNGFRTLDFVPPSVMPPPNATINLSNAVLIPPLPGENIIHHEKPDGCRTVYVGRLPEKITQDIIKEAFERSLLLRVWKIEDKDDPAYTAKLHVDYATARDDEHDFECRKRQKTEENIGTQDCRPPSPPPISHFSKT